jgi:SAM-dependent methyltransferase
MVSRVPKDLLLPTGLHLVALPCPRYPALIRSIVDPIAPKYATAPERTTGRLEGLVDFTSKLDKTFKWSLLYWTVLDIGGADGWLSDFLPCAHYYNIDPRSHPHVYGRAEALPCRDQSVDLVVSKQTLVHFDDPARACREMMRVARRAVVIRQEFPESPIGWPGHSRVQIDSPTDIIPALDRPGWVVVYDGLDFISVVVDTRRT